MLEANAKEVEEALQEIAKDQEAADKRNVEASDRERRLADWEAKSNQEVERLKKRSAALDRRESDLAAIEASLIEREFAMEQKASEIEARDAAVATASAAIEVIGDPTYADAILGSFITRIASNSPATAGAARAKGVKSA